MKVVFADTFFYLALFNRRDACHAPVLAFLDSYSGAVVTSQFVLVEVADACAGIPERSLLDGRFAALEADAGTTVIPASDRLFQSGLRLFHDRADKEWSLTDCTSFTIMHEHRIADALTGDHHFAQAGFRKMF